MSTLIRCMKKYACFSGRATRSEYWIFYLFTILITNLPALIGLIMMMAGSAEQNEAITGTGMMFIVIAVLLTFALLLPNLAVSVRRLHDIGESGTYLFMGLIPLAGPIILLVAFCKESQPGSNQYGISEKYPS